MVGGGMKPHGLLAALRHVASSQPGVDDVLQSPISGLMEQGRIFS